jgi:hypothetical protein
VLDGLGEDRARLVEIVAGIKHAVDLGAIACPLLDLIEVAVVRTERIVGFLVGPMLTHWRLRPQSSSAPGVLDLQPVITRADPFGYNARAA